MQTLAVKQHNYESDNFLPLDTSQEPPMTNTVQKNYLISVKKYINDPYMSYRAGITTKISELRDEYVSFSYGESTVLISKLVKQLGEILGNDCNLKGERVMLYAKNSPAWLLSDLAIGFMGGILAPLYDTLGLDNVCYCTETVASSIFFVSGDYLPIVLGALEHLPELQLIYCFDSLNNQNSGQITEFELPDEQKQQFLQKIMQTRAQLITQDFHGASDDGHSMYSIASRTSGGIQGGTSISEGQNGLKIQQETVDDIIFKKGEVQVGSRKVKVFCGFPNIEQNISSKEKEEQINSSIQLLENLLEQNDVLKSNKYNSIIFTSGTSGRPKSVVASHTNVISGGACLGRQFVPYHFSTRGKQIQNRFLSYLPLPHVFERNCEHLATFRGYHIFYSSGNIRNLPKDLQLSKPTILLGVPRVYCKIYQVVMQKLSQASKISQTIFWVAFHLKKLLMKKLPKLQRTGQLWLTDWVFRNIQAAFGGCVEYFVTGSSSMPLEVLDFMEICSCGVITRGYGLTEASATGLFCYCCQGIQNPKRDANLLGFACYENQINIIDRSDASNLSLEKDNVGELIIKGPGIVQGKIKDKWPEIETITDENGFYHTGDLVQLNHDGSVSFKRRVGLVVKLQQGEFVDLEAVEAALEFNPLVIAAVVHADADKPAPVALINLDSQVLVSKLKERQKGLDEKLEQFIKSYNNINYSDQNQVQQMSKLVTNPLYKELDDYLCEQGKQFVISKGLKGFNVPKAYFIHIDADWSSDPSLYTSTQKKRHSEIIRLFANHINSLWKLVDLREKPEKKTAKKSQNNTRQHKIRGVTSVLISTLIVGGIAVGLGLTKGQ